MEKDETEADALDRVEHAQPEPERDAEIGSCVSGPRDVECERGRAPKHLAPPWCTETDCEYGEKPRVRLAQPGEDAHHDSPADDEEGNDEKSDLPLGNIDIPEEAPVTAVGLGKSVVRTC